MADRKNRPAEGRRDKFVWKEGQARMFKTEAEADAWLRSMREKNGMAKPAAKKGGTAAKPKKK